MMTLTQNPTAPPSGPAAIFTRKRMSFFRRHATLILVLVSVTTGVLLQKAASKMVWGRPSAIPAATPTRVAGPVTLHGPGGTVTLPMKTPVMVNIWLEGCRDCMPAFEAYQAMGFAPQRAEDVKGRGLQTHGVPTVNVAYGSATAEWAAKYGLSENLMFDPGENLVKPLGIGTFTTLVLDEQGWVRFKGRPDDPGFAGKLDGVTQALMAPHGSPQR